MENERQPWERQDGERNLWYDRFTRFRLMGAGRTLQAVYDEWRVSKGRQRTGNIALSWRRNCDRWCWRERAAAWDEHLRQEAEAEWLKRREEQRQWEWDIRGRLAQKTEQMLMFPLARTERETYEGPDGKVTILHIVNPTDWKLRDAASLARVASELGRLAAEMETEKKTVDVNVAGGELTDAERRAALAAIFGYVDRIPEAGD